MRGGTWCVALLALVLAACGDEPGAGSGPDAPPAVGTRSLGPEATSTTFVRSALPGPEHWTPIAPSPLEARTPASSVWTGDELLIWRGQGPTSDACESRDGHTICGDPPFNDSAAYRPATDTWRLLPDPPLPDAKGTDEDVEAVWTGTEMVVWGGPDGKGAAYDPAADGWRRIADGPLAGGNGFTMTWSGDEVLIVSDEGSAAYAPATDTWRELPPQHRYAHRTAWTPMGLLVLGGYKTGGEPTDAIELLAPHADAWREVGRTEDRSTGPVVWTGTELVAVSGSREGTTSRAFDPATGAWRALDDPSPDRLIASALVWTGTEVILVGTPFSSPSEPDTRLAMALDPATGHWRSLPEPGLRARAGSALAWTGTELLVWGGAVPTGYTGHPLGDGARYSPPA